MRNSSPQPTPPRAPIESITRPFSRFLEFESSSGIVLLFATAAALLIANSPWSHPFLEFWEIPVGLRFGGYQFEHALHVWINDALMSLFFFVVGLEVKHELVHGSLRDPRQALLPVAGALGGMIVPAGLFLALQYGTPGARGWGIPMATDIAFVVGCMAIMGSRVPHGLRVLILTLAIADDIGAILVIAVGYTSGLNLTALAIAAGFLLLVSLAARLGVRSRMVYIILGSCVWFACHESGVHATIAGVILGLMTPARSYLTPEFFRQAATWLQELVALDAHGEDGHHHVRQVRRFQNFTTEIVSPLAYLQHTMHPWVAFVIMPLFAFANAGVEFHAHEIGAPIAQATAIGLVLGKPIGIVLSCYLVIALGIAKLPTAVSWRAMIGGGCLAGIGFTMALFIADLALDSTLLAHAKLGVLAGSLISAILGIGILATLPRPAERAIDAAEDQVEAEATAGKA